MDEPREALQKALKEAMINKDATRRTVIRMTLNAIKQVEVDDRKTLGADDQMVIVQREVKKRRDTIAEAEAAGRNDIANEEAEQLKILEAFLPQQMSREEIEVLAKEAIAETGASSPKEMGQVMGKLMPKVKGQADGRLVNEVVRELLSS
jgi:hypothetical protein